MRPVRNQLQKNSPTFDIFSGLEYKTRIHFKSDVFAAVTVVDTKAPYFHFLPERASSNAHYCNKYTMISDVINMSRARDKEKMWVPDRNWTYDLLYTDRML